MKAIAARQPSNDATRRHVSKEQTAAPSVRNGSIFSASDVAIQRKPTCPCGGGCPRCEELPIQTKLKINKPGDPYEQEADRVAEQVMRMPETQRQLEKELVHTKPVITPLIQRQIDEEIEEEEEGEEFLQTKELPGRSPEVTPALSSRIQSMKGGGQPLPESARAYFEPRFGHDFSKVRVHTDTIATVAANTVNARAFTVGNAIVLGAGQYSPASSEGRRLLAHELTHVVQQATLSNQPRPARFPSSPLAGSDFIQRSPDKPTEAKRRRERRLRELAKWPGDAHRAWKKLDAVDRTLVLWQMAANYGEPFASEFLKYTRSRPVFLNIHYGRGIEWVTPEWLRERGYRWVQTDLLQQWWVHPSGKTLTRAITENRPSPELPSEAPEEEPPSWVVIEGIEHWPTRLDPNADREALFGPIIAARENVDIAFGTGDVVLYENGTVELFLEGTTASYVLRPLPGGGYVVYGPDGRRLEMIWMIPEEDIPHPTTDAVE